MLMTLGLPPGKWWGRTVRSANVCTEKQKERRNDKKWNNISET